MSTRDIRSNLSTSTRGDTHGVIFIITGWHFVFSRYRTLARPASEASATTGLTPVGSPQAGGRANKVASGQEATGEAKQVSVEASQGEDVKNVNANKFESVDGVPNPNDVENDRITRTARYYFQPAHLNQ